LLGFNYAIITDDKALWPEDKEMIREQADLIAYNAQGRPVLVVEAKNKVGTSRNWAMQMRRNMLAHGQLPETTFFMLALPDRFYLWKEAPSPLGGDIEPTYEIDPTPLLQPYYERLGVSPGELSGESFELLVTSLLAEVLQARQNGAKLDRQSNWLTNSGLAEAITGGRVETEVSA
jgi:hypothetical protein